LETRRVRPFFRPPAIFWLALAYLVPVLLTLLLVTPPWQNPDEPLHMARAVQVAHGGLLGFRRWTTTGGMSDPAIYAAYMPVRHAAMRPDQRLTEADMQASEAVRFSAGTSYMSFPNTAQYPPFFYVPDAVAYWVGHAAGLGVDATLRLARGANALLFAVGAAAALALAGRARPVLAVLLLLPGTLQLACSASQDAGMLAACLVAVALLDRITTDHRAATRTEAWLVACLLTLVAMARPPYAGFLVLLLLLQPRITRASLLYVVGSAAVVLAWCGLVAWHSAVKLGHADPAAQLAFLAGHPSAWATILGATAGFYAWPYWSQLIGSLGWNDTDLPTPYLVGASLMLLLAALASGRAAPRRAWAPLAGWVFAVSTIFALQYLSWTWPGQLVITGVLGRYFMPPLIVLALALPVRLGWARRVALPGIVGLAAVTPVVMVHSLVQRFYG